MMKKLLTLVLALSMVFTFCACGNNTTTNNDENVNDEQEANNNEGNEDDASDDAEDGLVTYKVTVVDEDGNPVAGAFVQVCNAGNCFAPVATNDEGVAEFSLEESDEYKAKLLTNPTGYEAVETDYVYFEDEVELTLNVKTVEE